MNDMQVYALFRQKYAELIAEAEVRRTMPKRPAASRRWAAQTLHRLAERISPEPFRGHDHRPVPRVPTAA
jgi:hypothetical protein